MADTVNYYIYKALILSVVTIISARESSLVLNVAEFSSYLCKIQHFVQYLHF
jgi:ACT domain-containing protein